MGRWILAIVAVLVAAGIGLVVGYVRWGTEAVHVQRLQQQLQVRDSEATTLREQKRELEQRVEQVTREQERLAQENESLRKEQTKEQLLTGQGGELPPRPPK